MVGPPVRGANVPDFCAARRASIFRVFISFRARHDTFDIDRGRPAVVFANFKSKYRAGLWLVDAGAPKLAQMHEHLFATSRNIVWPDEAKPAFAHPLVKCSDWHGVSCWN
jgi:hypothetical protein